MPLNITVTKREIKNQKTGIDLSVTSHDPAPSAKQVKNYHVVAITRLPYFKHPEHGEDDVVQFMVRRDYAAFEKLQREILLAFPDLKLPAFPRKFHVFMDENDIEDRLVSFDCIVKIIARDSAMCRSAPILEFLGFDLLSDKKYFKGRREFLQAKEKEETSLKKKQEQVYGDDLAKKDKLFTDGNDELFSNDPQAKAEPFTADSIFEENGNSKVVRKSAKISVFEENDELFSGKSGREENGSETGDTRTLPETEDHSDLLDVTDTLDDVLKIVDTKKPKKVAPSSSKGGKKGGLFEVTDDTQASSEDMAADMGAVDIMKYIQQNQTTDDDDLDLF